VALLYAHQGFIASQNNDDLPFREDALKVIQHDLDTLKQAEPYFTRRTS
jgi:hypothetical protein